MHAFDRLRYNDRRRSGSAVRPNQHHPKGVAKMAWRVPCRRIVHRALLGFAAIAAVPGCTNSSDRAHPEDGREAASQATATSSGEVMPRETPGPEGTSAEGSSGRATGASIDPQAVNDDGLIELTRPVAGGGDGVGAADVDASSLDVLVDDSPPPESGTGRRGNPVPPPGSNLATRDELNQKIAEDWPTPQVVLFISGQQHGYLEPCGCTGLERQKGGLIRRDTLIQQIRDRGWEVVPVDVGNQVRRIGRQAEIKFQTTVNAFKMMGYEAATLGVDDLKLSSIEVIQAASSDQLNATGFITANVEILDPSFFPTHKIVEAGGRKIGVTGFTDEEYLDQISSPDVVIHPAVDRIKPIVQQLRDEGCDFIVLLAHASVERSAEVARQVGSVDLVVTAGGYGEPTLLPEPIEGTAAVMVQCGVKGMYGGIVGLFDDPQQPLRYQRIAISAQFPDSPRMLELFAAYQERLKQEGYAGLGIHPVLHPTGRQFVGSETCGDCHTTAYEIWEGTPHAHATDSIVAPPNDRGGIPRHFDPECISCHVTGWHPQDFYPYVSGWLSLEESPHLAGSGCENCHGPGQEHVAAENGDIDVDNDQLVALRKQMVLSLDRARDKCLECHDLDNSPDFHHDGAFEEYWEQVKHYGKD
ncbi:MAG: hypothetical protein D6753_05340 [Planctomycetota bacterium]|nr:MAG: hypothetical protein D6753_05340 [Planctomycetota bacterium]